MQSMGPVGSNRSAQDQNTVSKKDREDKEELFNDKLRKYKRMMLRFAKTKKGRPGSINKRLTATIKRMEKAGFDVPDYTKWEGYQEMIDAIDAKKNRDLEDLQNWSVSSQRGRNMNGVPPNGST